MGMPEQPHLEGGCASEHCSAFQKCAALRFQPPNRLIHSNSAEAFDFDNETLVGRRTSQHMHVS